MAAHRCGVDDRRICVVPGAAPRSALVIARASPGGSARMSDVSPLTPRHCRSSFASARSRIALAVYESSGISSKRSNRCNLTSRSGPSWRSCSSKRCSAPSAQCPNRAPRGAASTAADSCCDSTPSQTLSHLSSRTARGRAVPKNALEMGTVPVHGEFKMPRKVAIRHEQLRDAVDRSARPAAIYDSPLTGRKQRTATNVAEPSIQQPNWQFETHRAQ